MCLIMSHLSPHDTWEQSILEHASSESKLQIAILRGRLMLSLKFHMFMHAQLTCWSRFFTLVHRPLRYIRTATHIHAYSAHSFMHPSYRHSKRRGTCRTGLGLMRTGGELSGRVHFWHHMCGLGVDSHLPLFCLCPLPSSFHSHCP